MNHKSLIKNNSCMFNSYLYSPQPHGSSPVLLKALRNYLIAVNIRIGLGMPGRKTQFSEILWHNKQESRPCFVSTEGWELKSIAP